MRVAPVAVAATLLAALVSPSAQAQALSGPPYAAAVTAAERTATRAVVGLFLAAYRSGDFEPLCDVWSLRVVRAEYGTRARCKSMTARRPARPCRACTFSRLRASAVYLTAADRRAGRKMIAWLVFVKGDPTFERASDLELRFRQEQGRWMLTAIVQAG